MLRDQEGWTDFLSGRAAGRLSQSLPFSGSAAHLGLTWIPFTRCGPSVLTTYSLSAVLPGFPKAELCFHISDQIQFHPFSVC